MIPIILLPEAEEDLTDAAVFYEHERSGLGAEFTLEVEHALERLAGNPHAGPEVSDGARKLLLRRFPYLLIYRIRSDRVLVLAVAHQRRNPAYWRGRG